VSKYIGRIFTFRPYKGIKRQAFPVPKGLLWKHSRKGDAPPAVQLAQCAITKLGSALETEDRRNDQFKPEFKQNVKHSLLFPTGGNDNGNIISPLDAPDVRFTTEVYGYQAGDATRRRMQPIIPSLLNPTSPEQEVYLRRFLSIVGQRSRQNGPRPASRCSATTPPEEEMLLHDTLHEISQQVQQGVMPALITPSPVPVCPHQYVQPLPGLGVPQQHATNAFPHVFGYVAQGLLQQQYLQPLPGLGAPQQSAPNPFPNVVGYYSQAARPQHQMQQRGFPRPFLNPPLGLGAPLNPPPGLGAPLYPPPDFGAPQWRQNFAPEYIPGLGFSNMAVSPGVQMMMQSRARTEQHPERYPLPPPVKPKQYDFLLRDGGYIGVDEFYENL